MISTWLSAVNEIGTEGTESAAQWSFIDPHSRVTFETDRRCQDRRRSIVRALVKPYGGERVSLSFPTTGDLQIPLKNKSKLVFWIKSINENVPAWQNANPIVTLYESPSKFTRLRAATTICLSSPPYNEARDGWTYITVPLEGDKTWKREGEHHRERSILLTIGFDSWGTPPLTDLARWAGNSLTQSGLGKPPVAAGIVEQWLAAMMLARHDLPDENLMITARKNVDDRAIEERQASRQDW